MDSVKNHLLFEAKFLKFSAVVTKADDTLGRFMADFEKSLTRALLKEWQARAEKAVKAGLKEWNGRHTKTEAKGIVDAVADEMSKYGQDIGPEIEEQIKIFYEESTERFLKKFKIKRVKKAALIEGEASFTQVDAAAVKTIQRLTVQTAGRYFEDQLKAKVSEVVSDVVLNKGLSYDDAARAIEAELRATVGTEKLLENVPTRFHTNPGSYFNTLAVNSSVSAANVGRVIGMDDAGIEKFEVVAIIDARTSSICREMDGQILEVAAARKAIDSYLELDSLAGLEKLMPFSSDGSTPSWVKGGRGFPPYHHKCRTTVIPVFE